MNAFHSPPLHSQENQEIVSLDLEKPSYCSQFFLSEYRPIGPKLSDAQRLILLYFLKGQSCTFLSLDTCH